jgi:mannose-1-phosphate guanylyltransferase
METNTRMKAVIFAGGVGTRMWPLSRKKSPKQFEPIIEGKSTLQLAVDRLRPEFAWEDIYISTGAAYVDVIKAQLPAIPAENIIGEPVMRDVAPAVGYLMSLLSKKGFGQTPTTILWSDHLVEHVDTFKRALFAGATYLNDHPNKYIFIGQKPRFANQNLGWIEYGDTITTIDGIEAKSYKSWHYRPSVEQAEQYFKSGTHAWNPGYFVVKPDFVLGKYQQHAPKMYEQLMIIQAAIGTDAQQTQLELIYPQLEKISFDDAVVTKSDPEDAVVLSVDLGWADIGTWEALKEAVLSDPKENLIHGSVKTHDCQNNILYSYTDQMVAGIGIKDLTVVVTKDVIMVAPQSRIPDIKKLLAQFEGTPEERYT